MRRMRHLLSVQRRCASASAKFVPKQIETVPPALHNFLFPGKPTPSHSSGSAFCDSLEFPKLRADNALTHFEIIATEMTTPYRAHMQEIAGWDLAQSYAKLQRIQFAYDVGWTRYDHETGKIEKVPHPLEECCVFDVEVVVRDAEPTGKLPVMAMALTSKAWYSWCSGRLINNLLYAEFATVDNLIPLSQESQDHVPRLIVGHNVGFDRARTREPYLEKRTGLRYFDTMSAAIPIHGMADHQQGLYNKDDFSEAQPKQIRRSPFDRNLVRDVEELWRDRTTKVNLKDLSHFLCRADLDELSQRIAAMSKADRDFFVKEPIEYFRDRKVFQKCMEYCAFDVIATSKVFQKLLPAFLQMYPSNVSLYGFLHMGDTQLPINQYWPQFCQSCDNKMTAKKKQNAQALLNCAKQLAKDENQDPWLWTEDWSQSTRDCPTWLLSMYKKKVYFDEPHEELTMEHIISGRSKIVPKIFGMIFGPYPLFNHAKLGWGYLIPTSESDQLSPESFCDYQDGNQIIRMPAGMINKQIHKWRAELQNEHLLPAPHQERSCKIGPFQYYQLPKSLDDKSLGVATPFIAGYKQFLQGQLLKATRFEPEYEHNLDVFFSTTFWTNYSKRFSDEIHIWYPEKCTPSISTITMDDVLSGKTRMRGAIAAGIRPSGTVSRRAVHPLWVTLTNAKTSSEDRIGTHLKSMVQAPPGYKLVGADVDSQEQWLAALFGDASDAAGLCLEESRPGRTPFSNMALAGQKSDASDLHSVVANDLGISRDTAKTLNYARLYGAGKMNAVNTLVRTGLSEEVATTLATQLFENTKGKELLCRKLASIIVPFFKRFITEQGIKDGFIRLDGSYFMPDYQAGEDNVAYKFEQWIKQKMTEKGLFMNDESKAFVPRLYENFSICEKLFSGGYESSTFNFLTWSARQKEMRTPTLKCVLGSGLSVPDSDLKRGSQLFLQDHMRSRMNWIVQSSAVDFLHLLLLSMDWLCAEYQIKSRFVISIHDEVRYLCTDEDTPRCALALMWSNALVRATISHAVGIYQLPMNIAFFSQVDIDSVLRKEVDAPCENPDGTKPPAGEAWNFSTVLKRTNGGRLSK